VAADAEEGVNRNRAVAIVSLVLLPLVWLWPCVFGDREFVPYDVSMYPPASITADADSLQAARATGNRDVTEVPIWFLPELQLAHDELAAGRLPTWDPHARTGAPLHAHGLIGLLYPPNWPALLSADPASKLGLVAWCNLAIAGLLAFGLFRRLGFSLLAAWTAAALFELSGPMTANAFFWMRLASFVWLPGVLWAMLVVADGERPRALPTLALGAAFAMPWLAGFPPFAATTTVFAGLLFCWLVVERWRTHDLRAALRLASTLGGSLLLGALWAMPQVLPSLQFFPESARPPVPLWRDVSGQAFETYGLLGYLMPDAFGHPTLTAQLPYDKGPMQLLLNTRLLDDGKAALPNYNWTEYQVTVSTFGVVLAALGAWFGRGRLAWFARAALLLALGLALFVPGLQLLFHLPVVQNVWPFRWLAAATLFVVWLAALGVERLADVERRSWWPLALLPCALAAAVATDLWRYPEGPREQYVDQLCAHFDCDAEAVRNHVQPDAVPGIERFGFALERFHEHGVHAIWWLQACALALALMALLPRFRKHLLLAMALASIAQLAVHGASATHGAPADADAETEVHAFLRERADALAPGGGYTIVRASNVPGLPKQLPPGQLMHRGIRDLNFYSHADARSLQPIQRLLQDPRLQLGEGDDERIAGKGYLTRSLPAPMLRHPLFDLLGVRYVLATEPLRGVGARVGPEPKGRGEFFVYERATALPRAFVVGALDVRDDDEGVLAAMTADAFAPRAAALATRDDWGDDPAPARADGPREVTFVRDDPTHIELDVAAGDARLLVLADTFLPGWSATIDGEPAQVVRCNHSMRLVVLPETACRVTFTYGAPGLTTGLLLAAFATLSAIAAAWWIGRRTRAQA